MYNDTNHNCQLALDQIGPPEPWYQQWHVPDEISLNSDSPSDLNDLSSSISPLSFDYESDINYPDTDTLLIQILEEYSCQPFPDFADYGTLDQQSPNPHLKSNLSDDNLSFSADSFLFDGDIDQYDLFVVSQSPIKPSYSALPELNSTIKRKCKSVHISEYVPPIKVTKQLHSDSVTTTTKKVGNRDAAHRYRQKQKLKQSIDEEELEAANSDMMKAKTEMINIRQSMNAMMGIVKDLLSQNGANFVKHA